MTSLSPRAPAPATLSSFNAAPAQAAERDVLAWCESHALAKAIAGGRPYRDAAALTAAIDAAFGAFSWDDIDESMNVHPRSGELADRASVSLSGQYGTPDTSP